MGCSAVKGGGRIPGVSYSNEMTEARRVKFEQHKDEIKRNLCKERDN